MLTPARLAAIRALRAAITTVDTGDWCVKQDADATSDEKRHQVWAGDAQWSSAEPIALYTKVWSGYGDVWTRGLTEPDAAFIAAAPTVVDELLAEVERLQQEVHRLRPVLLAARKMIPVRVDNVVPMLTFFLDGEAAMTHPIPPTALDDALAENAELRALLHSLSREHAPDCLYSVDGGCDCGVEADRVQVRGLVTERMPDA